MLAKALTKVGSACAKTASNFSLMWVHDEPQCPKSLIK